MIVVVSKAGPPTAAPSVRSYEVPIERIIGGNNHGIEKVRELLVDQLDVEEDVVTMEANIQSDLGADSLDIVDLVMSLEEEFDCEIPDEEIENIKTVGDIVKYIEDHAN